MSLCVVDTNVILAANGSHENLSPGCVETCTSRLNTIKNNGTVVIDDQFRILLEYRNKTNSNRGRGPGDIFLKWLLQNKANVKHCIQVSLTEHAADVFEEFPVKALEDEFDAPDRKFVAVANAHPKKPCVLQATDCKWLNWHDDLKASGITVEFLCLDDVCRFYARKFPGKAVPLVE